MDANAILPKFEAFLLTEKCCALNTFHAYIRDVKQFERFLVKVNQKLSDTNEALLKQFIFDLKNNGTGSRSIARKISSLKVFFRWAHHQLAWYDFSKKLVVPKIEKNYRIILIRKKFRSF